MCYVRSSWCTYEDEKDDWCTLLIDVRNSLNEGNYKMMAHIVRHE